MQKSVSGLTKILSDPQQKRRWQGGLGLLVFALFVLSSVVVSRTVQALNLAAGNYGYYGGTYGYNTSTTSSDFPPNPPTSLSTSVTTSAITFSWTAPTQTTGSTSLDNLSGYCYQTGSSSVTTCTLSDSTQTGTSLTISNLGCSATRYIAVRAYDGNDNLSSALSGSATTSSCGGGGGGGGTVTGPTYPTGEVTAAPTPSAEPTASRVEPTLSNMTADAQLTVTADRSAITQAVGEAVNTGAESTWSSTVTSVLGTVPSNLMSSILYFVVYGTPTTEFLGAGERLGVVNSYRVAYSRLPSTVAHWNDIIKIGNGRWPGEFVTAAETAAKSRFRTIYLRTANMSNAKDNAAVTIMAYGLRPKPRNLNSERAAISIFKGIFKKNPASATDWDAVRAVGYSGAVR